MIKSKTITPETKSFTKYVTYLTWIKFNYFLRIIIEILSNLSVFKISLFRKEECLISLTWKKTTKMEIKPRKSCLKKYRKEWHLEFNQSLFKKKIIFVCLYKIPIMFVGVDIIAPGEIVTFISSHRVVSGVWTKIWVSTSRLALY